MKKLRNRKGVIALITMLVLAGAGILEISMVVMSQINSATANNYRYKIQTFNAADGLMTLLAQDMLDFNDSKYLTKRSDMDIGNPPVSGGYGYDTLTATDTLRGSGSLHVGVKDSCNFTYCQMKGNMELVTKFAAHKPGARGKAGIMIRQDLTAGAKYVLLAYVDRAIDTVRLQSRETANTSSAMRANVSGVALPMYLKLDKVDSIFYASYSTTGSKWTELGKDTVQLTDPVYVGLAIASGTNARDTAIFTNSQGIPVSTSLDTTTLGADSVPVIYRLTKMGVDNFTMETEGYKKTGGAMAHNYVTRLNQNLARESVGAWHFLALDSALVPATFYDFRSDLSCPEFGMRAEISPPPAYTSVMSSFVRSTIGPDRKPVLNLDNTFRTKLLQCYDSFPATPWYTTMTKAMRASKSGAYPNTCKNNAYSSNGNKSTWMFCDSMYRWFRPWGDYTWSTATYTFDTSSGTWTGLKKRPDAVGGQPTADSGWVCQDWDSTQHFANIVFYDTLKFRQNDSTGEDTSLFTFGRAKWALGRDSIWFVNNCAGFPAAEKIKFMPLKNKGFRNDFVNGSPANFTNACVNSQNFGFTMEIHRKFTYKPGQIFRFTGDDDVWVFINNQLVIDLGGVHSALSDTVFLNDLGLISGQDYCFDMFYCERTPNAADILVTTNMLIWTPPQPLKRSWKRDYGNLD